MQAIIGQRAARAILERAALSGQVHHAYLLSGPDAIGKTTLATEFARLLECQQRSPESAEPCGVCLSCRKIAHGNAPDVARIEPPQGRRTLGVETVREVQRAANLAPSDSAWRIFIIPDVERMTPEAVNALLKTLEEPPRGVVLLLTSAEPEQLLPTLLSRCQLVPLQPLPAEEVAAALHARWGVAEGESHTLAALANGRLGWAVRAHQQPELRERRAEELARLTSLTAASRDERIRQAATLGADGETARRVLDLWLLWWRDVVLAACGAQHLVTTEAARAEAERQGRALGRERAEAFLRALMNAQVALDQNANPRLAIEVLLLDLPSLSAAR